MRLGAVTLALGALLAGSSCSQPAPETGRTSTGADGRGPGSIVVSSRWPGRVVVDPPFQHLGVRTVTAGAAEAEIHVLADTAGGRLERFYWIQFEGRPAGSGAPYDYSGLPHQLTIDGYRFDAHTRFGAYSQTEMTEEFDTRTVREILRAAGFDYPAPMMRVRMATVSDGGYDELLVIYMERLGWSGAREAEFAASDSRWESASAALLERAADGLRIVSGD